MPYFYTIPQISSFLISNLTIKRSKKGGCSKVFSNTPPSPPPYRGYIIRINFKVEFGISKPKGFLTLQKSFLIFYFPGPIWYSLKSYLVSVLTLEFVIQKNMEKSLIFYLEQSSLTIKFQILVWHLLFKIVNSIHINIVFI